MIAGFAIEAMLKAAAIQKELNAGGIDRVIVGGASPRLKNWIKTHRLEKLMEMAGLQCDGESLLYLRRFEKYLTWAGRYPVPLAPPAKNEPRGFAYALGIQDRSRFQEIFSLAKDAYLRTRAAGQSDSEPVVNLGNYIQREAAWVAALTEWLRFLRPILTRHAQTMARGERGVVMIRIDTEEMRRHIAAKHAIFQLEPAWFSVEDFIAGLGDGRTGVSKEDGKRWAAQLMTMDPREDVAFFLLSTPDPEGRWFSRFTFLKRGGE
jgi:hypothetical protein